MDCHQYANIAKPTQTAVIAAFNQLKLAGSKAPRSLVAASTSKANADASYASYYSFVFSAHTVR
ncbi:hypothetical protein ACFOEE_17315 [Pseudoalteromonas fenneropenaei]|uniref:Uncharacterized protein n=1 Tax=Pseudoalteromonas fenneropenaei TaxID=1737459 RepID=A0ABV7CP45_9GAMM